MVRGRAIAVTAVTVVYQCAETTRMARGLGTPAPNDCHAFEYRFVSSAFIGLPCPRKAAGMSGAVVMTHSCWHWPCVRARNSFQTRDPRSKHGSATEGECGASRMHARSLDLRVLDRLPATSHHLANNPYRIMVASGHWTCTVADGRGSMIGL